jgi:hypothetical protein
MPVAMYVAVGTIQKSAQPYHETDWGYWEQKFLSCMPFS